MAVCSVIDECRCYTYSDVPDPKKYQFCGVRRGSVVVACPEEECCDGGCPGEYPKEPFRILDRPVYDTHNPKKMMLLILIIISIVFLMYAMT
jgi:hypothetical protein